MMKLPLLLLFCLVAGIIVRSVDGELSADLQRPTALSGYSGCFPVSSGLVHPRDLAPAVPEFSRLSQDLTFGYAPAPGMERVFRIPDLQRIARQNHVEAQIKRSACLAWKLSPLEKSRVVAAMQGALVGRQAEIDVVDQTNATVPDGELIFPLAGLGAFSEKPFVWRGFITYVENRRFFVWALVRVKVREPHLVATRNIHRGEPLSAEFFRPIQYEGPLSRDRAVSDISQADDFLAARDIAEGTTLVASMLSSSDDVERGNSVTVIAISGAAHLETQGVATQSGSSGDLILVKNPASGHLFKARILGKGKVLVVPSVLSGLVGGDNKS